MTRRRRSTPPPPAAADEVVASLRLYDRTATDWAFSAEGFLLLYDPSVVTDPVFAQLFGLQTIARCALGWMNGDGETHPTLGELFHEHARGRAATAAQVARLTQLGWECSLTVLPFVVACNGADVRFRPTPLSADERKAHLAHYRAHNRGRVREPERAWLITRKPRLGVTWDFMLGFTPAQKRKTFGPGYQVEIDWPPGAYQVKGWTFPDVENDEVGCVSQYVLQLEEWTSETEST